MKQLNLFLLTFLCFLFTNSIFSQAEKNRELIEKNNWLSISESSLNVDDFFKNKYADFGLKNPELMHQTKVIKGKNGLKHSKFQQYYNGLKVLGGEYILHEKNGKLKNANGIILPNINLDTQSKISSAGLKYIVQNQAIKEEQNKNKGEKVNLFDFNNLKIEPIELVVVDKSFPDHSGNYALAQVVEVEFPVYPPHRDHYLINAHSGQLITVLPQICHTEVEGRVQTRYSGEQTITVDSVAPNRFLLQDFSRGNGIVTINDITNAPFEDSDNYWENFNSEQDEVAGDAHFGAISFYDYLLNTFNWKGLDNQGKDLTSIIHAFEGETYVNAFWDGTKATFGDGNCGDYSPLTTLDVVGHEFAHGLTEFSSGLVYRGESGGINEGMSDVFGKALEYYFSLPGTFDWDLGGGFVTGQGVEPFRSLKNPNWYENPKYYKGDFWDFDFEGVHNLSGVFGHWFYLLVEGARGTNEAGLRYDVKSIGMDNAMEIIFAIETGYLTTTSDYVETALMSLEASNAIFGIDSDESKNVEEAWKAVGLFLTNNTQNDLAIEIINQEVLICGENDEFIAEFRITNTGSDVAKAGQNLMVELKLVDFINDVKVSFIEPFELSTDLTQGGFENFKFNEKLVRNDFKTIQNESKKS